jgi:hypothetical protein
LRLKPYKRGTKVIIGMIRDCPEMMPDTKISNMLSIIVEGFIFELPRLEKPAAVQETALDFLRRQTFQIRPNRLKSYQNAPNPLSVCELTC